MPPYPVPAPCSPLQTRTDLERCQREKARKGVLRQTSRPQNPKDPGLRQGLMDTLLPEGHVMEWLTGCEEDLPSANMATLRAIRAKCLWCSNDQHKEVEACAASSCFLHSYRIESRVMPDKIYLAAIRRKCLDCQTGSHVEVERCGSFDCPLWLFRFGRYSGRPERDTNHLPISPGGLQTKRLPPRKGHQ
jgi:hypothetical protein